MYRHGTGMLIYTGCGGVCGWWYGSCYEHVRDKFSKKNWMSHYPASPDVYKQMVGIVCTN